MINVVSTTRNLYVSCALPQSYAVNAMLILSIRAPSNLNQIIFYCIKKSCDTHKSFVGVFL